MCHAPPVRGIAFGIICTALSGNDISEAARSPSKPVQVGVLDVVTKPVQVGVLEVIVTKNMLADASVAPAGHHLP